MSDSFDPYHVWLGIPPEEQPPDHYRLLGLRQFEENRDVISHAAEQRMSHLRSMQAGPRSQDTQILLNQLAAARSCLMVPEQKSAYDAKLRQQSEIEPQLVFVPPMTVNKPSEPWRQSSYRTDVASPMVLLLVFGMVAGLSLIAVVALVLSWRYAGPVAAEAKRNVQASPVVEAPRELPPIVRPDQSIEPPSPKPVESETTEPTPLPNSTPTPPPMDSPRTVVPPSDVEVTVEPPAEIEPKQNFAVRLKDVGDAIELENTADLFPFNREFTVELWARFHPTPEARSLIGTQVSLEDGSSAGWLLHIPGPAFKDKNRYITLNGEFRFGAHLPDIKSDWQHLAVCSRAGSLGVFVNGSQVLVADNGADLWSASDSNIMIGKNPRNMNYKMMGRNKIAHNIGDFRGDIRALRITSKCLYEENFVPSPVFESRADDLVSLDFTIGDGDIVPDVSGNGHDGRIVSGEWVELPDPVLESSLDAPPPSDVEVSGQTRDWMSKSYRNFSGPDAEEFASVYQKEGYRRLQNQVIAVNRPVVAPTVFLAQGVELYAGVRANVAIVAQRVDLHGVVEGNLDVWAQVIHVKPGAIIKGNIRVESAQTIRIEGRVEGIIIGAYGGIRAE